MFKLVVVSGPNLGTQYPLNSGELTLGRQEGNGIVLQSSKISKKHCTIQVASDGVSIKDEGSSNGTFVNGILVKQKKLKPGDRVSVGEYVLELAEAAKPAVRKAASVGVRKATSAFPTRQAARPSPAFAGQSQIMNMDQFNAPLSTHQEAPKDFFGKLNWYFEHVIMPNIYGANLKTEWRMICLSLFAVFVVGNLILTVYPLLEANRNALVKESLIRAKFLAKQISEMNAPQLAAHAETKTDLGIIENAEGVRVAVLTDLDNRIIAPGSRLNQYLNTGLEASFAIKARDLFRAGRETGVAGEVDSSTVVAIEPVKVLSPAAGKNVVVAMAVVSIDTSLATPDLGEMGMVYSESLILTGILGGLVLLMMYRLTLKPFSVLNEDLDKALKGDISQVTHEYKFEELNSLWEIINSAIQRIPRADQPGGGTFGLGVGGASGPAEFEGPLKMLGGLVKMGFILFDGDRKILYLNSLFEELTGIRPDGALGRDISEVARDQALGAFTNDLMDRSPVGGEGLCEDFDFSGISHKVYLGAFGSMGQAAKCFVMVAVRVEE